MEEVTAGVYLVSISQSRYSAVYDGGHAKTVFLHAAISAAAHQTCEMLMNAQFRFCRDERSELVPKKSTRYDRYPLYCTIVREQIVRLSFGSLIRAAAGAFSRYTVALTEFASRSLPVKVHIKKKSGGQKTRR